MPGVSGVVSNREVCGLRAADLVFDPTLACCKVDAPAPAVRRRLRLRTLRHLRGTHPLVTSGPEDRERAGQGLPLNRTMLSNHKLPYVGRFACDWPRLATTDPHAARDKCTPPGAAGRRLTPPTSRFSSLPRLHRRSRRAGGSRRTDPCWRWVGGLPATPSWPSRWPTES